MILLIDNYDSFVYNLARYVSELGFAYLVKRNNVISLAEIQVLQPTHIIISPGPGTPDDAGISMQVIHALGQSIPILGVCLGHQAIGQVYGGKVVRAQRPMHGKASFITHDKTGLFKQLDNPLAVARYHSLIVRDEALLPELMVTARCEIGEVMAVAHKRYPLYGVQFHPESVLTQSGYQLLENFLEVAAFGMTAHDFG